MLPTPPPTVSDIVVSPNFAYDSVVLAGTMEDGVFRSADGGRTWSRWNFGLLDLNVICLAISPNFAEDDTLYAGTESGIFRSANGGRAWREVEMPFGFEPVLSLALSPNYGQDGTLFAGSESHGLWRSCDEGESWTRLGESAIDDIINDIVLSPNYPEQPDILVAMAEALLISRDGGETWSQWEGGTIAEHGVAGVIAPAGLSEGSPLLVGTVEAGVVRLS
jgi:photosystem II stability/assembly factor-like uncharacterized protein